MEQPLSYFLTRPKYWGGLLGFSLVALLGKLPLSMQLLIAKGIAAIMRRFGGRRNRIAERNLALCFPQMSENDRAKLLERNIHATALGLVETAACWFSDIGSRHKNTEIKGREHLDAALAKGKGVLLLSFHLTSLEVGGSLLCQEYPVWGMYKPNKKNALVESIMRRGRLRHADDLVRRSDLRKTVRALKNNQIIWYATDQNYGNKAAVFAPFFGIQASTITATTKFAKLTGAAVVPFTHKRLDGGRGYELELYPAFENFPGQSETEDATRINRFLEDYLRQHPVDYMWLHQRFRTRPPGEPPIY